MHKILISTSSRYPARRFGRGDAPMSEEGKLADHRASKGPKRVQASEKPPGEGKKNRQRAGANAAPGLPKDEAVEYIASLLEGLRSVATGANLSFLAYLIGLACEEAQAEKSRE
jgi:hypothetical protein